MSSTSSTTSPDDVGSTSTEATGEDATRPFPAAGDTQPLTSPVTQPVTMPLPASGRRRGDGLHGLGPCVLGVEPGVERRDGH